MFVFPLSEVLVIAEVSSVLCHDIMQIFASDAIRL